MSEPSLADYLSHHRDGVESALARATDALAARLPEDLAAPARHGVLSGGKRLRPLLLVAAHEACGGTAGGTLYDLAAAVELIHAYSLMHDDLPCMDDAPLRRGRPTPHTLFGVPSTTLAGVALIPWAAACACRSLDGLGFGRDECAAVAQVLLDAAGAGGMVGGQALDLLGEGMALGEDELRHLHRLKTGALLTASLTMGAMSARADAPVVSAVERFGGCLGLAFQVMDDVLDATASAEALGKEPSDADLGKSTYVLLLGVEGARTRAEHLVGEGLAALDGVRLEARRLRELARYVIERER